MGKDVSFWLVRHAAVHGPAGVIWPAEARASLDDAAALDLVGAELPKNAISFASPAQRTVETARALRLDPILMSEFSEQDFGAWTSQRHDDLATSGGEDYARFWRDPAHSRPPGGESFADQIARVRRGLGQIDAGPAILVVHSGTIRAALAIALDLAPEAALRFVIDPLSVTRIDRLQDGWRVVCVNQTFR
jgi:alpha-ribazole phosphatase